MRHHGIDLRKKESQRRVSMARTHPAPGDDAGTVAGSRTIGIGSRRGRSIGCHQHWSGSDRPSVAGCRVCDDSAPFSHTRTLSALEVVEGKGFEAPTSVIPRSYRTRPVQNNMANRGRSHHPAPPGDGSPFAPCPSGLRAQHRLMELHDESLAVDGLGPRLQHNFRRLEPRFAANLTRPLAPLTRGPLRPHNLAPGVSPPGPTPASLGGPHSRPLLTRC
jgi:hypothetical protein